MAELAQGHRRAERFAGVDQYRLMAESFAAAVLAGEPVPYAPDDAVRNMRAIDALARSAARNCGEDITPMS